MDQIITTDDQAVPATEGWVSHETWAEYRWEGRWPRHWVPERSWKKPVEQDPILESELPF